MTLNSGEEVANGIGSMLDISLLKYEERDLVADALRKTNRKVSALHCKLSQGSE